MNTFKQYESNVQCYANNFPVVFTSAKGAWLFTEDNKQYLDFLSGAGALNYGHNNPIFKQQLMDYIDKDGITHGLDMHSEAKAHFLESLQHYILQPRNLDYKVQFTGPTGTNAVESALKLARKITGRNNIVAFTNGFHGVSYGALAATGNQHHRGGAGTSLTDVTRMPYDEYAKGVDGLALFEAMLDDNSAGLDKPAAVILEVVQGEGGLNVASNPWLQKLERICKQNEILLIVDDIQAGCGRTGSFFSFENSGIKPDIVTLSKSISGYGLPMAIVLMKPHLDAWSPGEHNGTFRGNNHAFVTATAAIEAYWKTTEFEEQIQMRAMQVNQVLARMNTKFTDLFKQVKGRGLMQGIECHHGDIASQITQICFEKGLIIETAGPEDEVIKFFCPLTIAEHELDNGLSIFVEACDKVASKHFSKAS